MNKRFKLIKIMFFISSMLLIGLLSGCTNGNSSTSDNGKASSNNKATYINITPEDAKKRLDSEKGIVLLDVRTKEEYDTGHIKGSILIPVDVLEQEAAKKLVDKEAHIFIYCRSGNRSVTAANILIKQGYKNVYNLGGINDWPFDVEK